MTKISLPLSLTTDPECAKVRLRVGDELMMFCSPLDHFCSENISRQRRLHVNYSHLGCVDASDSMMPEENLQIHTNAWLTSEYDRRARCDVNKDY